MIKNINDFFDSKGIPKLERPLTKSTMAVKHHDETNWSNESPYPCYVLRKYDGINCILLNFNHKYMCFTREGKRMKNMEKFEEYLAEQQYPYILNTMINCEVCNDDLSLEELGAVVKSTRKKELTKKEYYFHKESYLVAFDIIDLDEFIEGKTDTPFSNRFSSMEHLPKYGFRLPEYVFAVTKQEADAFFNRVVKRGGEGVVQVLRHSPWIAGYKNQYKTKRVCGVDYDLEVDGVEEGKGKRQGMVANLIVRWRKYGELSNEPELIPVDGCFTDDDRIAWFTDPKEIIGKVVHVHALKIGSQGGLRIAKVKAIRIDKSEADL